MPPAALPFRIRALLIPAWFASQPKKSSPRPALCLGILMPSWDRIARRIRVPMGFVFAAVYIWLARPTLRSIIAGSCVALLGLLIRALASGHVKKNEQLTISGPYAYTRNPLYLGSLFLAAGFAIAARSRWIALIAIIIFFVVYIPVMRSEEDFLRAHFPE